MSDEKPKCRVRVETKGNRLPRGPMVADYIHDYLWIGGYDDNDQWCVGTIPYSELKKLYRALHKTFGKPKHDNPN